jgi:trans-2,3-dihydro-3-hydroxyanthranilate isomerase
MPLRFVLCDVFASRPFAGNPLAVFLDAGGVSDDAMRALAIEFGWSEITFVAVAGGVPRVRIWTPYGELPFAGHPTIGTAVVLVSEGIIEPGWGTVELGIGAVAVEVTPTQTGGEATMVQGIPEFGSVVEDRGMLAGALGLQEGDLADDLPAQMVSTGLRHFMVPLRSLDALGRARPEPKLEDITTPLTGLPWAYLFTPQAPGSTAAVRARLLAPGMEDAATGSAAGPLGGYLVRYGLHRPGDLEIEQGIEMGRPSKIRVSVPVSSGEIGPVRVSGEVRIWGQGTVEDRALASPMLEP